MHYGANPFFLLFKLEEMGMNSVFEEMIATWPSPLVARCEVAKFSGGVLNPRTLANLDCLGCGPANRMRVGRKICYSAVDLVNWMKSRSVELGE